MLYKAPIDPSLPKTRIEYDDPHYILIHNETLVLSTTSKSIAIEHKRKFELNHNYTIKSL